MTGAAPENVTPATAQTPKATEQEEPAPILGDTFTMNVLAAIFGEGYEASDVLRACAHIRLLYAQAAAQKGDRVRARVDVSIAEQLVDLADDVDDQLIEAGLVEEESAEAD